MVLLPSVELVFSVADVAAVAEVVASVRDEAATAGGFDGKEATVDPADLACAKEAAGAAARGSSFFVAGVALLEIH